MRENRKGKCLVFNEESRRDFVTGFHKRKLERKKHFEEKLQKDLKEAKKRIKAKVRETLRKIIPSFDQTQHVPAIFEKQYALPEHIVRVRELLPEDIARENNWIGQNKALDIEKADVDIGDHLTSIKAVKKVVSSHATALIKQDKAFQKKNLVEKRKNKKKATQAKRTFQREQKRRKQKRRR